MTIQLCKYLLLEMRLKWKLGQKNVQLNIRSDRFLIIVKNNFGIVIYAYDYNTDLSDVYEDIIKDYIVR